MRRGITSSLHVLIYFQALVTSGGASCLAWTGIPQCIVYSQVCLIVSPSSCRDWPCRSLFIWLAFVSYWLKLPSVNWLWPFGGVHNYRILTNAFTVLQAFLICLVIQITKRFSYSFAHMTNMKLGPHHT